MALRFKMQRNQIREYYYLVLPQLKHQPHARMFINYKKSELFMCCANP